MSFYNMIEFLKVDLSSIGEGHQGWLGGVVDLVLPWGTENISVFPGWDCFRISLVQSLFSYEQTRPFKFRNDRGFKRQILEQLNKCSLDLNIVRQL